MGLKPEQQKMLEDLLKLQEEEDADDFEVEIFSGDKGARIPYKQAAKWLHQEFGIGDAPAPPAGAEGQEGEGASRASALGRQVQGGARRLFAANGS